MSSLLDTLYLRYSFAVEIAVSLVSKYMGNKASKC